MRDIRITLAAAALATVCACSGGSDEAPPAANPAAFPTAADAYEGAARDDTSLTASRISVGGAQARTLFPDFDADWVKVDLVGGTEYEISANRLSRNADVYLRLYASDGTTLLGEADDYVHRDPELLFTPGASGTFLLLVTSYDAATSSSRSALAAYTLSVHPFVDADGDGYSSYYDCDDDDPTIAPYEADVVGDGIDQDCDGMDALDSSLPDAFEPDDDSTHARSLAATVGDPAEYWYERAMIRANARTLETIGEEDWFRFTVPAHGAVELGELGYTPNATTTVYDGADMSVVDGPTTTFYGWIENTTAAPKTYYAQFVLDSGDAFYVPYQLSYGLDLDGDGAYTEDWDGNRDCDDGDPAVHPGATETAADGVDSDCDGHDDT